MDDDVKNLFQKFGQTTDSYREINRDADSEQARQRWPLLRDVHVNGAPTPKRTHAHEPEVAVPGTAQTAGMFNPASAKASAKPASARQMTAAAPMPPAAATSLLAAATAPAAVKAAPVKQILAKQHVNDAEVEVEDVAAPASLAPAFMSRNMQTAQREVAHAAAKAETPASSLFAQRQPVASEPPKTRAPAPAMAPALAPNVTPAAPAPAATSVLQAIGGRRSAAQPQEGTAPSKNVPVSAVFDRLAAKPEEEKPVETGVNSFFKKIFKP
ncbi:cellulose biosynthesis protein BcsP [Undibacterium sp. Di26W]|uniref:cellulose biosynthesis protein BcsP n=1 Tax=Undibacterium sp. Di26W TaxID=3413035 RepID=UPI003BF43D3F